MTDQSQALPSLLEKLDAATARLEQARPFAKERHRSAVLELARRVLAEPGGVEALYARAPRLDAGGLFAGSDWDHPATLLPQLVGNTLETGAPPIVTLEVTSLLRLLAVATSAATHENVHTDHARHFLTQVLALNLRHFFHSSSEATRAAGGDGLERRLFRFIADHIGLRDVLGVLVTEIWRILEQRPVQVAPVKEMIMQISIAMTEQGSAPGEERLGADRLVSALFGPTTACRDDPGIAVFLDRVASYDDAALMREATGFSRAMHDTGLVSDYHAAFLRWVATREGTSLVPETLGLGHTGLDCWRRFEPLVRRLIDAAVRPETPQAVQGLALLLERGVLHYAPIEPALSGQIGARLHGAAAERVRLAFGDAIPPESRVLSGLLEVLGQPLGVGQGANPTCQSARAIAMWALNDPDYLMHLVRQVSEHDDVLMHFEGQPITSAGLPIGLSLVPPIDADPVSVLLVPHLDRVYAEMGRLCAPRGGDPHRWVNPEFHGWWVARDCVVAVDIATGQLDDYSGFVSRFYRSYNPEMNGGRPVIHPQPAGIAVTNSAARFVGWHAIAILRVDTDPQGTQRVYFYNPNNDSGQDWGDGVVVSTHGAGERHGEASLPFEQFVSRLYLFHDDPAQPEDATDAIDPDVVARIEGLATASWAADRHAGAGAMAGAGV